MAEFIEFFANFLGQIANLLNNYDLGGISLLGIFVGAIAISIICNIFWKGAKG